MAEQYMVINKKIYICIINSLIKYFINSLISHKRELRYYVLQCDTFR